MQDQIKSAELKEKLKAISERERNEKLSSDIQEAIIGFMGGATRSIAFGSVVYVSLLALAIRVGFAQFSWLESVCLYGTLEIIINALKRFRGQ
jgi:hypothetical protein